MSQYAGVKATINANIKTNNNEEITGLILNSVLNEMVTNLEAGYLFKGVAATNTNPGSPDQRVFYVAAPGTYAHFSNIVVPEATTGFLKWDTSWHLETISTGVADGAVTEAKLASALATKLLATGYKYMGKATPSTDPGLPDQNVFYIAGEGDFPNFGNITVPQGGGVLRYDTAWHLDSLAGIGETLDMGQVAEDGIYYIDENLNIGAEVVQNGIFAINTLSYNIL